MEFEIDRRFRTAVLLGIASIPVIVGYNSLVAQSNASVGPLIVACLISGYLSQSRSGSRTYPAVITGLIGGVPIVVWRSLEAFRLLRDHQIVTDAVGDSLPMLGVSVIGALLTSGIVLVTLIAVAAIAGIIGGWIKKRTAPFSNTA